MAKFRLPRKSLPTYRRPLTDEEKAKQVEDSKKAKKTKANKRLRRRLKFKQAKAQDLADIKKTLKSIDKVKKPNVSKLKLKSRLTKTSKALKGNRAIQKAIGVGKHAGKLRYLKGLAKGGIAAGITIAADKVTDEVLDRAFKGKKTLKEYRADKALFEKVGRKKYLKLKGKTAEKKELKAKNEAVTNPKSSTKPAAKPATKSQPKVSTQEQTERAAWLKKTRNSPAAEAGVFSDDERWGLQKKHRAWKASRRKPKKKR